MKITLIVKEVNSKFDQDLADKENDGQESEYNIRYNWEDEFELKNDIKEFKIRNNEIYILEGMKGEIKFSHKIPSMTIIECIEENGNITQFATSRKLIKDTKKNVDKNGAIRFYIFLKGGQEQINPIPGIYISKKDFPNELPLPEEDDITCDEEA